MQRRILPALTLAALMAPAVGTAANGLDYSYVEGGLALYPDFDGQDFLGLDTKASFAITPDVFAFGGLKYLSDDVDLTAFHIGGGYRLAIDSQTDVYGGPTIEYQDVEFEAGGRDFSVDDTALGIRGGVRHRLSNALELAGQVRLVTGDMDYVGFTGTARYFLDDRLSLIGELDSYDGELGLIGGARLSF